MLTYLLTKKELTPEEVVGVAIDVVGAGVDTVSICTYILLTKREGHIGRISALLDLSSKDHAQHWSIQKDQGLGFFQYDLIYNVSEP